MFTSQFVKDKGMYYLSLIFALFPMYSAMIDKDYIFFSTTLLFVIGYIITVHTDKTLYQHIGWLVMCVYIIYIAINSPVSTIFFFYQINLMTFKFNDYHEYKLYWLSLIVELVICYSIFIYQQQSIAVIMQVMVLHLFGIGMYLLLSQKIRNITLDKQLQARNQSLSFLLAENERQRISQDLHDTLGHVFVMLSIKSELAQTLLTQKNYEAATQQLIELRHITQTSMQEVRQIIHNMKQITLEDELNLVKQMLELVDIQLTVVKNVDISRLSSAEQASLSMILRELVNNLLKYSRATQCRVELHHNHNQLVLLFEDNGRGFDAPNKDDLRNIRDRVAKHEGYVKIISRVQPTQIKIMIPIGV